MTLELLAVVVAPPPWTSPFAGIERSPRRCCYRSGQEAEKLHLGMQACRKGQSERVSETTQLLDDAGGTGSAGTSISMKHAEVTPRQDHPAWLLGSVNLPGADGIGTSA